MLNLIAATVANEQFWFPARHVVSASLHKYVSLRRQWCIETFLSLSAVYGNRVLSKRRLLEFIVEFWQSISYFSQLYSPMGAHLIRLCRSASLKKNEIASKLRRSSTLYSSEELLFIKNASYIRRRRRHRRWSIVSEINSKQKLISKWIFHVFPSNFRLNRSSDPSGLIAEHNADFASIASSEWM